MPIYMYSGRMGSKSKSKSKSKTLPDSMRSKKNKVLKEMKDKTNTRKNRRIAIEQLVNVVKDKNTRKNKKTTMEQLLTHPHGQANYLKSICSQSGVCIAFGQEQKKIRQLFRNFIDFSLVSKRPKRIGNPSANGFVYEVPFDINGYHADTILKSSSSADADNLLYEYLVGNYINHEFLSFFPCLVETYGLFQYTNPKAFLNAFTKNQLSHMLVNLKYIPDVKYSQVVHSCENPVQYCVLIQHLKDAISIKDYVLGMKKQGERDLIYMLFQIYFFLHTTQDFFTHYDLHYGNVLVYEPVKGKKIRYTYTLENGHVFTFDSPYLPKIIDYGRCYTPKNMGLYMAVCQTPSCDPDCGKELGYQWFVNDYPENTENYITSLYPNNSHDLRLYNMVRFLIEKRNFDSIILRKMRKCMYTEQYGTPPVAMVNSNPEYICNVTDCYNNLVETMDYIHTELEPPKTPDKNLLAHIRVYPGTSRPMSVDYLQ